MELGRDLEVGRGSAQPILGLDLSATLLSMVVESAPAGLLRPQAVPVTWILVAGRLPRGPHFRVGLLRQKPAHIC